MAGYTRQSAASIINGENITAPPLNAEFNAIATAFADATGHAHDGTTGQGPKIDLTTSITGYLPAAHGGNAGKNNYAATSNPGVGDDINDGYNVGSVWYNVPDDRYWVCMYSAAGAAVWLENRFVNTNNDIAPHATNTVDLGATLKRFKDLFLSGNADIDGTINVASTAYFGGTLSVQGNTTLNGDVTLGNSATDDINVTARFADDLIPSADDSRDLGSSTLQWRDLHLDGTANIDILDVHENAAVAGNTTLTGTLGVTGDTTVANLTSTGTSTHATVDINGGSIDGVDIGSNSVGTGAFSTITASGNITGNLVGNVTGNVSGVITGNVTGNITSSGTSSFTTIAVSGGTVNGAVIGGSSPAAITGTTITSNNGFTGDLTGDVTGNLTGNVTGNVTATTGDTTLNNLTVNGTVDVTSANIVNVLDPTSAQHAATKNYVDVQVSNLVASAPGTLDTLNELAAALGDDPNFSTTVTNSIATKLPLAGGTMTGNLNMGSQNITNLNSPVNASDAATKGYIDTVFGSTSSAATSATNAANSATAAASSATDAANSYDSFDDRYLGAKNDLDTRTTDNDGDALVTGALAFDSVNNVMKVWDGSEFVAASSSIDGIKNSFRYTATAGQTVFSGSDANSQTLVIDQAGLVNVFLNGVRLIQGSGQDYTVSAANNNITLLSAAAVNDVVEIEVFGNFAGTAATSVNIGGGSVTGLTSLGVSGGNATFGDDDRIKLGDDSDVQLYHDGLNNQVVINSGNLYFTQNEADKDIIFYSDDGSGGTAAYLNIDGSEGAVKLRHYGDLKLKTIASGIDVTGNIYITGSGGNPNIRIDDNDTSNNGEITLDGTALRIEVDEDAAIADSLIKFRVDGSNKAVINASGQFIINDGDVSTGAGTNKALLQVANIDTTSDWTAINTGVNTYASTANEIAVLNTANQDLNGFAGIFFQAGESSNGSSINSARIGAIKTSTTGTNTDLAFASRNGSAQMVEHVRITSSGRLGINQDSPTSMIHLAQPSDDAAGGLQIRNSGGTSSIFIYQESNNTIYDSGTAGSQIFRTNNNNRFQIYNAGNVVVNESGLDQNFKVESDNNANILYVDGGSDYVGVGGNGNYEGILNVIKDSSGTVLSLVGNADSSSHGPNVRIFRNSDTPAANDYGGRINFDGRNSAGAAKTYAQILTQFKDVADGSEDARLKLGGMQAGTFVNFFDATTSTTVINEDGVDRNFRVESDTVANAIYVDGTTGDVGIGTTPTRARLHISDGNSDINMNGTADGQLHIDGNGYGFGIALNTSGAQLYTSSGSRDIIFGVNETEVGRFNSDGLSFNGDNSTDTSLDDYEQGSLTWRLYKVGHSGTGSNNTATNVKYVKVGRLVTITGYIRTDGTNGSSGTIAMTGTLPYSPSHHVTLPITHTRSVTTSDRDEALSIMCANGTTGPLYIYENDDDGDYTAAENNVAVNSQTNLVITFQGSYYTSQ